MPSRGHTPPGVPPGPDDVDLAVVGPMARSAADLSLLLDVIAGPDEPLATGYQLALRPPRHTRLADFRVLVLDTHPLLPTALAITSAMARLTERLAKSGCSISHSTPLLPDLSLAGRIYIQQLMAFMDGPDMPAEAYRGMQSMAAALPPHDTSLMSARVRGIVLSHRDWVQAERIRSGIRMRWATLFREWDVVVCPAISTLALAHDHGHRQQRTVDINGQSCGYDDLLVWPGVATLPGLPSTAIPLEISEAGLPVGVQVIGPFLEDRTTLKFAELVEQAFGGFVAPAAFAAAA